MSQPPFIVYLHIHRNSGRAYVGQTSCARSKRKVPCDPGQAMMERWEEHCKEATGNGAHNRFFFQRAISKYGVEAFDHAVLEHSIQTHAEADEAERCWIERLKTMAPYGFNLRVGSKFVPEIEERRIAAVRNMSPETKARSHAKRVATIGPQRFHEIAKRRRASQIANTTPEQRSATGRKRMMALPKEERVARATRASMAAAAKLSPEERAERGRRQMMMLSPDQRSAFAALGGRTQHARLTPEQRSAQARERRAKQVAATTTEQRSASARKRWTNMTPEGRAIAERDAIAGLQKFRNSQNARARSDQLSAQQKKAQQALGEDRRREIAKARVSKIRPEVLRACGKALAARWETLSNEERVANRAKAVATRAKNKHLTKEQRAALRKIVNRDCNRARNEQKRQARLTALEAVDKDDKKMCR